LEAEDFQYYLDGFKRAGFRGGINWYRNFTRNWQLSEGSEQKIAHPSLMICAADDRVLPPSMADGMPAYVDNLETHIIEDCGHWTQNEQPDALGRLMTDWMLRRFG
jgi:pimeloyl-ACP methyl ester carboxylesterase